VLWGGVDDSSGGRYSPASDSWAPTALVNAPHVRDGGRWSTVWTGFQMIIWGGESATQQGSVYCASGFVRPWPRDSSQPTSNRR
jgi:hypothetical protein